MQVLEEVLIFVSSFVAIYSVYLIVTVSLNVQRGFAGIPQFGLVLPVAGGAYVVGNLANKIALWMLGMKTDLDPVMESSAVLSLVNPVLSSQPHLAMGLFLLCLLIGAVVGAVLGLLQVAPAIKLRIDYLSITLLAFGEIMNVIARAYRPLVGGSYGVQTPMVFGWAGKYTMDVTALVMLLIALLIYAYAEYLGRTPLGRTLKAIRDNEVAAAALGKSIVKYRAIAIVIGSAFCGVAGALWGFYNGSVIPGQFTRFNWTFLPWLMIFLGGLGNNKGALAGATVFVVIDRLITYYKHEFTGLLPFEVIWLYQIVLGILTAIILIYRPQGILPERPYIPKDVRERLGRRAGRS
ncbi:MAG: branched-chain amino acid ABC transporter permease [Candidatus Korarchaeota archaeon NZ13-K]|nr:MAG: branched-chain amino acid ABC transporter permease [Candidatus Korarchaeota archaeon NZ13-K]